VEEFHQELARVAFTAGDELGLVLAGGYAISAHDFTERPSQDLDFATAAALPLEEIAKRLADVYRRAGYGVSLIEGTPRMVRLESMTAAEHARSTCSRRLSARRRAWRSDQCSPRTTLSASR
jgi:hypothetical protein